jgi:hypothetical protein
MPSSTAHRAAAQARLPEALRWAALAWLAVWVPAYGHAWGLANFLHLCDIAVFLTCIGLWGRNRLLLSSQLVSSLLVDAAWCVDAVSSVCLNRRLIGGTLYLLDPHTAAWIRALSWFHLLLPALLLWVIWRTGYDRRAWALQCAIALLAFVAARFTNPATNINYAFRAPFMNRQIGPAPVHVLVSVLFLAFFAYLPAHLAFLRIYRRRPAESSPAA